MEVKLAQRPRDVDVVFHYAQQFMRMATDRAVERGVVEIPMSAARYGEFQAEIQEGRHHREEREIDALHFKNGYKALMNEFTEERMKAESSVALNTQHDKIEAAKKAFKDELNQAKLKMEDDVKKLQEDLQYAQERKNHYKNNCLEAAGFVNVLQHLRRLLTI
eukprot:s2101_g10.t1